MSRARPLCASLASSGILLLLGASNAGAPLSYDLVEVPPPHDAPSVAFCRNQIFASSNDGPPYAIVRIDAARLRVLEMRTYRGLGQLHQMTTDGRWLYAAYFTRNERGGLTFGIVKVDPETLTIQSQLRLESYQVSGFPEGFAWHDGYLYAVAYGTPGSVAGKIARIEPHSMTFAGAVTIPNREGCHGITYDGFHLYALGVPVPGRYANDHYYKIDPNSLEIVGTLDFPQGVYHYGGNVYLSRNGFIYASPDQEAGGALVKIDPKSFSIVGVLRGAGAHWLATEGRYVYLVAGRSVRVVDPDALVIVGESSPRFHTDESLLHYGYVAGDGNLYLGFESHGVERGYVGRMRTLVPFDATPPASPQKVYAHAEEPGPVIDWAPVSDPETSVLEYRIYRARHGESLEHLVTVAGASRRYTDRSADANRTYVYAVAPVNGSGVEGSATASELVTAKALTVGLGASLVVTLDARALPLEGWATAEFVAPSGVRNAVQAEYSGPGKWSLRFAPRETGRWRYAVTGSEPGMMRFGAFECRRD